MDVSFGNTLRRCREELNLTQEKIAELAGISHSAVSHFERGDRDPKKETAEKLIGALSLKNASRAWVDRLWQAYLGLQDTEFPIEEIYQHVVKGLSKEEVEVFNYVLRETIDIFQTHFGVARSSLEERRWEIAIEHREALNAKIEGLTQQLYLLNHRPLAKAYYSYGKYSLAIQYYMSAWLGARQAEELLGRAEAKHQEGRLLLNLGSTERRIGNPFHWKAAERYYRQAKDIFVSLRDRRWEGICLRKMAGLYLLWGRPDVALPLCEESLEIAEREGDKEAIYKSLQHKGWAYEKLGYLEESASLFEEAFNRLVKLKANPDEWEVTKAHWYLGDAFLRLGRLDRALEQFTEAKNRIEKNRERGIETAIISGQIWLGLGKTYGQLQGHQADAQEFFREYWSIAQRLEGEDFRWAEALRAQGELLLKFGRISEAERKLTQAKEAFRDLDITLEYVKTLVPLCSLYYMHKKSYSSIYITAEEARNQDNGLINEALAEIHLIVGKARIQEGHYREAATAFCEATDWALKFNPITFNKISKATVDEIYQLARQGVFRPADELYISLEEFWKGKRKDAEPAKLHLVEQMLEKIQRQREEIAVLLLAK